MSADFNNYKDSFDDDRNDCVGLVSDRLDHYLRKNATNLDPHDLERIHSLQIKLNHHVFEIAAFGLVSCGKTAVLNALQGKKVGLTGPLHGTTEELNSHLASLNPEPVASNLENSQKVQVRLIDTPGLNEVLGEVRAEIATKAAHQADLILFVTSGDLTRQELEAIAQLQTAFKPILLIFNKADLYPDSDRHLIHQALQDQELQNLISTDEIVFTSAEPLPRRVRRQYTDTSQEIWETMATDVKALKQKILDLLNQDGKALLALNTMRSLLEIHVNVTQKKLERLPQRPIASGVFVIKAIAILISPSLALDFILSVLIDGSLLSAANTLGYINLGAGLSLSVTSAIILSNIHNHYAQIGWIAIATVWLIDWLKQDLLKPHILKQFIERLQISSCQSSILHRLKFEF